MKKKTIKTIILITFLSIVLCSQTLSVKAYNETSAVRKLMDKNELTYGGIALTYDEFDADYYYLNNPDVASVLGNNKDALYMHYLNYGYAEGRKYRLDQKGLSKIYFDTATYAATYPDLAAAYGNNSSALLNHYLTSGYAEGRSAFFTSPQRAAENQICNIYKQITNESMTDSEKVKAVHDWLCKNLSYGYASQNPKDSYYLTGAILNNKAVCQGYADAFAYFMFVAGIKCDTISGTADGGSHAWNKVLVDGIWYYIDVTWDDPIGNVNPGGIVASYDYYLTTDPTFGGDHIKEGRFKINWQN